MNCGGNIITIDSSYPEIGYVLNENITWSTGEKGPRILIISQGYHVLPFVNSIVKDKRIIIDNNLFCYAHRLLSKGGQRLGGITAEEGALDILDGESIPPIDFISYMSQACYSGDIPMIKCLIDLVPINHIDNDFTFLMKACREGHSEVVDILLEAGADPNIVTKQGNAIYMAALNNNSFAWQHENYISIIKKLLNKGVSHSIPSNIKYNTYTSILDFIIDPDEKEELTKLLK